MFVWVICTKRGNRFYPRFTDWSGVLNAYKSKKRAIQRGNDNMVKNGWVKMYKLVEVKEDE